MAFTPVPGTASVVARGHCNGDLPLLNVYHYSIGSATLDTALATTIADAVGAPYKAHLQGGMNSDCGFDDVVVTDLRTEGAPEILWTPTDWPFVGSSSAGALPNQVAAVVNWKTALRGRSYTGRSFLGGFAEDFSAGRDISSTLHTALVAFAAAMVGIGQLGVVSRVHDKVKLTEGVFTNIIDSTVPTHWRTMRRRLHD